MNVIEETLSNVHIGPSASFRNLTIYPIFGATRPNDYVTLDEALANGAAVVTEISEQGHVPELQFVNQAEMSVLLVDGEELIGAKQNRILNISILAPALCSLKIPVSCVEAGRWRAQSRAFRSSPRAHYASGRAMKLKDVSLSMSGSECKPDRAQPSREMSGTAQRNSNQSAVWADIDRKMRRLRASSTTSAMSDIFEQHAAAVEEYVGAFQPQENQVGAGFLIGGQLIGVELFDTPRSFERLFPKLIRSYALDAIDDSMELPRSVADQSPETKSFSDFLKAAASAHYESFKAVGEGEDLRFSNSQVSGAALYARERIVHLTAFANSDRKA